ncbi:probable pectinesterase 29 [Humulus lupulus]|uniref:probable pectinesterase 29 n=1 Tax=Humulus lupulus TaxID=3486 RepID=UPI002B4185B5|nr:probable pectinesterase 29 [Humulus lupulus]
MKAFCKGFTHIGYKYSLKNLARSVHFTGLANLRTAFDGDGHGHSHDRVLPHGDGLANGEYWQSRRVGVISNGGNFQTITVDQSGHGNFNTIQSAIDSVPSNNKYWIYIIIKAGVYREKITIPSNKSFIILKGEGRRETQVVWNDHQTIAQSPAFSCSASFVVVHSMSFTNSYNHPAAAANQNPRAPAVAALVSGDKIKFYNCGFYGLQDTLWDDSGRHYYENCLIEGAVDFIFGSGQSIFEQCTISVIGGSLEAGYVGFITAQGRTKNNDGSGFVFKNCHVDGTGSVFLGRPWRPYSRVLFYNSYLSKVIVPQGWNAWNSVGYEGQLTFAEESCSGPGSDLSRRVTWEKKLSKDTLNQLTSLNFIDSEHWLAQMPL